MQTESAGVKVTHAGIEIVYHETENRWKFELRGRCRSAESLAKAKEYIDKPVTEKEEKPFTRFQAWVKQYSSYAKCEVTSIAEPGYYGTQYWVVVATKDRYGRDDKERKKVGGSVLFELSERNDKLIAEFVELGKEIDRLNEERAACEKKLKPIQKL